MLRINFYPASKNEKYVFGANRPGWPETYLISKESVLFWIAYVKSKGIKKIVCLLSSGEMSDYEECLMSIYIAEFGKENVLHAPVRESERSDRDIVANDIIPFIEKAVNEGKKLVVHCAFGEVRTGHVLRCWNERIIKNPLPPMTQEEIELHKAEQQ